MAQRRHEVVVAGGGVVGAATALALFRQGLDVALVERGAPPAPFNPAGYDPRVYALSPGTVRWLESLGVWSRVAAGRVSPYEHMRVWENDPARALRFDAAELTVPELGFIVEDGLLRSTLWAALGGATIYPGVAAAGLQADEKLSRLELANGDVLEAALLVSAEGADSPLREWAGIEPVGWSYPQRSIVCHVTTGRPHQGTAWQRFLPNGPLAFLPLADGRSSIVWSTAQREADELLSLEDEAFGVRLAQAFDQQLGEIVDSSPRLSFPLRLLHAPEYVRPGLALVGDSAHVIHPMAGQGINLGLADAQALAETLAQARALRRPLGNLRVLKRYERRRKADNLEALALTDGLYRLFGARAPAITGLREWGLSQVGRAEPLPFTNSRWLFLVRDLVKRELARRAMGLT